MIISRTTTAVSRPSAIRFRASAVRRYTKRRRFDRRLRIAFKRLNFVFARGISYVISRRVSYAVNEYFRDFSRDYFYDSHIFFMHAIVRIENLILFFIFTYNRYFYNVIL